MARQDLGSAPSRPTDLTTVLWVTETYPSTSATISSTNSFTITLPSEPIDHSMYLVEVHAQAEIVVSVPNTVLLTTGTQPTVPLFAGKVGFFGFRFSSIAGSWYLLSATAQV